MLPCLKFAQNCFVLYSDYKQNLSILILPPDNGDKMSENKTGKFFPVYSVLQ